ncbi:MAG: hypothetical protein CENE_02079 [Candidatus Celerinatantimonas neptuna]|nr:MAG: hypothetical protein CENE_02079 [Candidatus Celerinatantimonas neptuna]
MVENTSSKGLLDWLGIPVLAVAAHYRNGLMDCCDVYICGVYIQLDNSLKVYFPNGHQLQVGDRLTIHLDNRSGVSDYDASLSVYRTSYKGWVSETGEFVVYVVPVEYQLFYGMDIPLQYAQANYQFPDDVRKEVSLPISELTDVPVFDMCEQENKIGVLVTHAMKQPHTTVLAFLSSQNDDIFFITLPETFKSKLLKRHPFCFFAIDSRAVFTYTRAIEWNYSLIAATTYQIPKDHHLFKPIQAAFIEKNPWEVGFFSHPEIEMYHLKADHVVCPGHGPD